MKQKIFIAGSALLSLVVNLFGGWDTALETLILFEYYGAAEPPVRCGESHLSGLTEPPQFVY